MRKHLKIKKLLVLVILANSAFADWTVCEEISDVYEQEKSLCYKRYINSEFGDGGFCVECLPELPETNPWADVAKVAIPSLAMFGAAYVGAKYQYKSQKEWANAYEGGIKSCNGTIDNYQAYNLEVGANPITGKEQTSMLNACNGNSMGMYAGGLGLTGGLYGGVGGSGFINNGYSGGYMGGMIGPNFGGGYTGGMYGNNGMYGNGMGINAQVNLNPWGSLAGGALAGLLTGGNLYGGISVNGGMGMGNGMGYPGYGGGYGMGMGYPGYGAGYGMGYGMNGGMYPGMGGGIGIGGMYPGMGGGIGTGGMYPGMGGGIGIGGNIGIGTGGMYPGMNTGIGLPGMYPGMNGSLGMGTGGMYPGYNGTAGYGLNNYYGNGNTGAWGSSGGWQAQAQAQQYLAYMNQGQNSAASSRYQQNQVGNAYANQALYQNLQGAQSNLYGNMYGGANGQMYSSGYNPYGSVGVSAQYGVGASAGFQW